MVCWGGGSGCLFILGGLVMQFVLLFGLGWLFSCLLFDLLILFVVCWCWVVLMFLLCMWLLLDVLFKCVVF